MCRDGSLNRREVETNYDSGKQTWRSSLAIDERQWWVWAWTPCGNCAWKVSALSLLSSSSAKQPKLERSWVNCAKPKSRQSKTWRRKPCFWRTKSSSLIADQISAPVLSTPTNLLREQIRWSTAPSVLGQTEPAELQNQTPDPAAPSDLVLLLGTNRTPPRSSNFSSVSVNTRTQSVCESRSHVPLSLGEPCVMDCCWTVVESNQRYTVNPENFVRTKFSYAQVG